jgi:hypothetical protein
MKVFYRIFLLSAILPLQLLYQGCGRNSAPDPPLSRSRLTLELFKNLEKKKHDIALAKIRRLRQIDKNNIFLAYLELNELSNIALISAGKELEKGRPEKALKILSSAEKEIRGSKRLTEAVKKILFVKKISELLKKMNRPVDSIQLARAAVAFRTIMKSFPPSQVFAPYVNKKIRIAYQLEKVENKEAVKSLISEIKIALNENNNLAETMLAELAVENPGHYMIENYIQKMKERKNNGSIYGNN